MSSSRVDSCHTPKKHSDMATNKYKLVFDIGAHVGDFAAVAAKCSDRVVTVEANPTVVSMQRLRFNTTLNVNVHEHLMGETPDETVPFYTNAITTLSTASSRWMVDSRYATGFKKTFWNDPIDLKVKTLDCLIREHGTPDLIKIDVEGYELKVIRGLTKRGNVKMICFEWVAEMLSSALEAAKYLHHLGFTQFAVQHDDEYMAVPSLDDFKPHDDWARQVAAEVSNDDWGMVWCK
jgi:FkbM family methyltransferase